MYPVLVASMTDPLAMNQTEMAMRDSDALSYTLYSSGSITFGDDKVDSKYILKTVNQKCNTFTVSE